MGEFGNQAWQRQAEMRQQLHILKNSVEDGSIPESMGNLLLGLDARALDAIIYRLNVKGINNLYDLADRIERNENTGQAEILLQQLDGEKNLEKEKTLITQLTDLAS